MYKVFSNFGLAFFKKPARPYSENKFEKFSIYIERFHSVFKLNENIINHLQKDITSKLIIIHDWSPSYCHTYAGQLKKIIETFQIKTDQLLYIMLDETQNYDMAQSLANYKINDLFFQARNGLFIDVTPIYNSEYLPQYKFSMLTRSFRPWRLDFYVQLIEHKLLDSFIYSFSNEEPHDYNNPIHSKEFIKSHDCVISSKYRLELEDWIDNLPYLIHNNIHDLYSSSLDSAIKKSYFNIILESHIDTPMPFITEKTAKAIAAKRPFIIYGVEGSINHLHKMGFKSFNPIIDESYDNVSDNIDRRNYILKEIKRLNNLPQSMLENIFLQCQKITEFNFNRLLEIRNFQWSDKFKMLDIFI